MSLRVKIPLFIGLIVLISSAAIIITVERVVSKNLEESLYKQLAGETKFNAELISAMIDVDLVQLSEIANRARTRSMDWEGTVRDSLVLDVTRIGSFDIGVVSPDGTTRYVTDPQATANLGDRDYIRRAFAGEKTVDVLMSRVTNSLVEMQAVPILQNDEPGASVLGVMVARKGAVAVSNLVKAIRIEYKSGYATLVNKEGRYIAHPDSKLVEDQFNPVEAAQKDPSLKPLGDMIAAATKESSGHAAYVQDGKKMISVFSETPGYPWTLILTMERSDTLANIYRIRFAMFAIGAICAIVGIIVAIIIGRSIAMPMIHIAATLKDIGEGDLTRRIGVSSGNMTSRGNLDSGDELGALGRTVDNLAAGLQKIIRTIHANSDNLTRAGENLSEVSSQLKRGSEETVSQSNTVASTAEQLTVNINAMAGGAEQASVNANEVAGTAEQMSVNINTIADAVEKMSESINQIAENTVEVHKVATDATNKAADATKVMSELGAAANEIGHVTDVIREIANKTNLLALNATIEAAGAGEAGKGFAVVAGEIKELANQSAQSADDIARRIKSIQSGTDNAVNVINTVSDIITKISQSVEAISGYVDEQTKAGGEIANNVAQANSGAKRVASAIGEVAHGMNDVSRNAGEAARGASNVSVSISNMNQVARDGAEGAAQVHQSADDLSKIAQELKQTVTRFKV